MSEFTVDLTSEEGRRKTTLTTRRIKGHADCVAEIHIGIRREGVKNPVIGWVELDPNQAAELRDYLNEAIK